MKHGQKGRKLGRTSSHKRAMLSNMAVSLFEHGSIRTTLPKAKELRGVAERMITFAKRGDLAARRQILRRIQNKVIVSKLFDEIGPSFSDRQGGYTRILKIGPRRGDATEVCMIQLVGNEPVPSGAQEARTPAKAEKPSASAAGGSAEEA
ncbi:MAG: 50S ribosomal protein L17 [bacterium]|nr:50S ribosomal protein L17 [bacterium]